MNLLVTGGAGFIGSNFLNLYCPAHPGHNFINADKLTYAANLLNLTALDKLNNYRFERFDLTDYLAVEKLFVQYAPDIVIHFAAESHVDRSIHGPSAFIQSNIIGTFNLLEACRHHWLNGDNKTSSSIQNGGFDQITPSPLRGEGRGGGEIFCQPAGSKVQSME